MHGMEQLTAGELEVADMFVERKAAELHPLADRRQITPERGRERKGNEEKTFGSETEFRFHS